MTGNCGRLGQHRATLSPGPIPRDRSRFATWFAAEFSMAYESRAPPHTSAWRRGTSRAESSRIAERLSISDPRRWHHGHTCTYCQGQVSIRFFTHVHHVTRREPRHPSQGPPWPGPCRARTLVPLSGRRFDGRRRLRDGRRALDLPPAWLPLRMRAHALPPYTLGR